MNNPRGDPSARESLLEVQELVDGYMMQEVSERQHKQTQDIYDKLLEYIKKEEANAKDEKSSHCLQILHSCPYQDRKTGIENGF